MKQFEKKKRKKKKGKKFAKTMLSSSCHSKLHDLNCGKKSFEAWFNKSATQICSPTQTANISIL